MKMQITDRFFQTVVAVAVGSLLVGVSAARTFAVLHSFTAIDSATGANDDGANPSGLVLSDNTLYGTAGYGGTLGNGSVFAINTDGSGFRSIYNFRGASDGGPPFGLILSGTIVYGTAVGVWGYGSGFAVSTDGTGFTNLYTFTIPSGSVNADGVGPVGLILADNMLYGIAGSGGSSGNGTVFALNTDGTGFATLYHFSSNYDGAGPSALVLSGNTLYGTTFDGGSSGGGTVFVLNTDGSGFGVLHNFAAFTDPSARGLVLSANTLYGTLEEGGSSGSGAVFAINTDGTGFRTVYSFSAYTNPPGGAYVNSDGAFPRGALILSSNTLYGTTHAGGNSGNGTVFALSTDGTRFTLLHSFTNTSQNPYYGTNSEGADPDRLILAGNRLYGAALRGGSGGSGTIFSISLPVTPPQLTISSVGAQVVLTWPTNATAFILQSTTNLGASAIWTTNSATPVIVNGLNTVTNPISGSQQFYRLSQ